MKFIYFKESGAYIIMKKVIDHYYKKAKEENYAARSVYKLIEIDQKYHIIKRGMKILDIGCSPGSWSQYILKRISKGKLFGIDISDKIKTKISSKDKRFTFIKSDIFNINIDFLKKKTGELDLILSDISPNTTGDKFLDSQISLRMLKQVFAISDALLKPGKNVVAKVFQGEDLEGYLNDNIKSKYKMIQRFKPKSSRKESKEIYIIAIGKKA